MDKLIERHTVLGDELNSAHLTINQQAEEICALKVNQVNQHRLDTIAEQEKTLQLQINFAENQLRERQEALMELTQALDKQTARLSEAHGEENEVRERVAQQLAEVGVLEKEIDQHRREFACLQDELDDIKKMHRLALEIGQGDKVIEGHRLSMNVKERRLIELLDELVGLYSDFASDFAAIKWKKVWLPKVQEMCSHEALETRSGIYMIKVHIGEGKDGSHEPTETRSYIGQAVNIKERWYQHVKKMLGVDGRGHERLYEVVDGHVE